MVQKRACDACYKRKIQCDKTSSESRCDWCNHQDLACTYDRVRGRKKVSKNLAVSKPLSTAQATHQRNREPGRKCVKEDAKASSFVIDQPTSRGTLHQPHESLSPSTISSPSYRDSVSSSQINYGGCHFGHLSHQNGMPLLTEEGRRWIASRTGEEISPRLFEPRYRRYLTRPRLVTAENYSSPEALYELPDIGLVETVFHIFIHSAFIMIFPLVDRELFPETLALAYNSPSERLSIESVSAKACVMALVSAVCGFKERNAALPSLDVEHYGTKARFLLTSTAEDASLTSLQACLLLYLHDTFTGRLQSALTFHAMACRIAFRLGGHVQLPPKKIVTRADRERRQIRLMFWICYIIDKDTALRSGQPPLMSGEYCDLTIPDGYNDCYKYLPLLDDRIPLSAQETLLTPYLPEDPRLSRMKEKVSQRLYSAQAARKTNAELLKDIRELDEELEAWRLSIPDVFRPALSISSKSRVDHGEMALPRSMAHITLHLGYHHVMTAIHRASGRCMPSADASADSEDWLPGVRSSMALALEASRSTLVYLRAAIRGIAGEAFWVIVFYPTAAMMTLFCNILMDPLNEEVEGDIALLATTADLIHSLPIHRLTSHELTHIELVTEFVAELCRLSKKATAKAMAEYRQLGVTGNGNSGS